MIKRKSRNIIVNVLISLVFIPSGILSQGKNFNLPEKNKEIFNRIKPKQFGNKNFGSIEFYPLNDGDFWEYITADTTTLLGQFYDRLNFSITKEITGDTLMTNGILYKKVRWENIANSINYPEWYNYHRVDTAGNVYLFYEGSDYLLFDFSLGIGQSYSSHLPDQIWKIVNRYEVIGFGDTLQAIDFELLLQGTMLKEKYTIIQNFGIVYYQQNIGSYLVPEGNFWGAVINGEEYGTLIVQKQEVDWKEFYPLHIGDYWLYEGQSGSIPTFSTVRIIGDTIMPDANTYLTTKSIDYTFGNTTFSYRRIDSLGNVFFWESWNDSARNALVFSNVVGDTFTNTNAMYTIWRIDDKYISIIFEKEELRIFLYPDLIFYSEDYTYGLGLTHWTSEQAWQYLQGAIINGVLYGDTTITGVNNKNNSIPIGYNLFQNYPNPFNPSTTIKYSIRESGEVTITIYDVLGRKVTNLVNDFKSEGSFEINFNANNLASGVYIYRIVASKNGRIQFTDSKQMILLR